MTSFYARRFRGIGTGSPYLNAERPAPTASLLVLVLVLCALVGTARPEVAYAQSRHEKMPHYTFALVGVPLADALERLIDETRLSLAYTSALVANQTTFCKAERVTPERLLSCILQGTGLDFVRLSSGTYVLITDWRTPPRYASLTGQILDAATGTPLADASVLLVGENTGTATNRDGRFAFAALKPGPHRLAVTHVAYHDVVDTVYVEPDRHGRVTLTLKPRVVLSEPVVINGFAARLPSDRLGAGTRTAEDLASSDLVGTPDVVQHLAAVPGVRLGDALSDVHVQGGAASEQPFLLDGAPVYTPVPSGGFVGPFSPFAVDHITVRKAGFGARHGSYLSGVIEVEQQLAPQEDQKLTTQVDPLSVNARWSGTLDAEGRPKASWMVAGRKGLWDVYRPARLASLFESWSTPDRFLLEALRTPTDRPVSPEGTSSVSPGALEVGFSDIHAAARIRLDDLHSLRLSLYRGSNAFGTENVTLSGEAEPTAAEEDVFEDAYRWTNRTAHLRYDWVQSRRLFMNASVWGTDYRLVHPVSLSADVDAGASTSLDRDAASTDEPPGSDEFNELTEWGVRLGGDLAASTRHYFSGALEASHTGSAFALSLDPFGAAPAGPEDIRPARWRLAAFLEDRVALGHRTTVTLGTRWTYLPLQETVYAEPRLAFQYDREVGAQGSWSTRWAAGLYRQYTHSFDVATYNVTALLPRVRFWLPVGRDQRPPKAYHAIAAFLYRPDARWTFTVESYYKHQPHLSVLDYGGQAEVDANPPAPEGQAGRDVLATADGYAYGVALGTSRDGARLQVDAQYEYAVARRRVPNRFDGAFVPVPWNAPHRLYLALDVRPLPHWTATVRWQGVFGRSWGFRQAYYDFLAPHAATRQFPPFDLSKPDAHRLPAFSRWDVGLAYARDVAGVGVQGRVTITNVLGRRNVTDWSLHYDDRAGTYVRDPRRAASFIPSASLRLSL